MDEIQKMEMESLEAKLRLDIKVSEQELAKLRQRAQEELSIIGSASVIDVLSVHKLQVIDASGALVALIGSANGGGTIATFNVKTGKQLAGVNVTDDGYAVLRLANGNGQNVATIGSAPNGDGGVWVNNRHGSAQLSVEASTFSGDLKIYNSDTGQLIAYMGATVGGDGGVVLSNSQGVKTWAR